MPSAFADVAETLSSDRLVPQAFGELDGDGNGEVNLSEITSYDRDNTGALAGLLRYIEQEMGMGLRGEDIKTLGA